MAGADARHRAITGRGSPPLGLEEVVDPPPANHRGSHPVSATEPKSEAARLLTAEDVADRWQVTACHVYRLSREGRLPTVKLGRYRRFRLAEIEAFEAAGGSGVADE